MRWNFKNIPQKERVDALMSALNIDEVIATLLLQRGINSYESAKKFFRPKWEDLHDPYLMKDMDKAVNRLSLAINQSEKILVFGDYDVDGTTSVAMMSDYLLRFTDKINTYIPDRYAEGYGISKQGIDFAYDNEISLIIALDCGIKSNDYIDYATSKNIDFIICDHHLPSQELPTAVAILDPKRDDCSYPFKELCGCGVGFKLIQAYHQKNQFPDEQIMEYLDLVATAIAADIVPMVGENRILAKLGVDLINSNPRAGIQAIFENRKKKKYTISDLVFTVAPRINAAGRIDHGRLAVALLGQNDFDTAKELAKSIDELNTERKEFDSSITLDALQQIYEAKEEENYATVVYKENWHKGVIGIVASRLIEKLHKPTIVFTKSGDKLAASARSVKGFDLYKAIENCSQYLIQYGGHMHAAGMTIKEENYHDFKLAFEKEVRQTIKKESLEPEETVDMAIDFSQITPKTIRILEQFEPFGPENMTPVFYTKEVYDSGYAKSIGKNEEHLKLFVKDKYNFAYSGIAFGKGDKINMVKDQQLFEMIYSIEENEFNNQVSTQLQIKDIR